MPKVTKCTGEGQGSCKRCNDKGKWNRNWMCFLNKIEGYDGCYCNDCTKEILKECEQEVEVSNRANLQDHIMSLIPDTIDTDAGTHIYLMYQERLKIAEAIATGFIKPIEYYNLSIEEFVDKLATIDMPYNEFHTDISDNGTRYRLTFITTEKNNFLAMQDLARKFIDGKEYLSLENRILVLEHDKRRREIREKVMSIFASMQYGKLCTDPERIAYYKQKLNEIFGSGAYQDTDSVRGENE